MAHTFEIYSGTHTSNIADRIEAKMMPFFSKNLAFGEAGEAGRESRQDGSPTATALRD